MDGAWNLWDIKPPPICTVKTVLHVKEMTSLNEIVFQAKKTLSELQHLEREVAILSRIIYKHKRIYRHDKGMQTLVKIHQCLKRYHKLDMSGILSTFKRSLPYKFNSVATHAYLPTQQMLKWVLLRFQAFSQIFVRLINLTKEVGTFYLEKSWLGWTNNMSFMIFSISARILCTSKYLVKKSIEWYNSMYKYLPFLQKTPGFLPDLPENLKTWLGPVDLSPLKKKSFIDKIFKVIDLAKDGDKEDEDEVVEVKILNERFINSFFKNEEKDVDVEEILVEKVEETKKEKRELKRPMASSQYEDLGVSVEKERKVIESPVRNEKKHKEGKRQKWLKKMKKNLNNYEKLGANESFVGGSLKKSEESYIAID